MIGMTGDSAGPATRVQGVYPMFALDRIDYQRIAISAIGALILSTACIVGAVGPAQAASIAPATQTVR
jgi:hypothetical protein